MDNELAMDGGAAAQFSAPAAMAAWMQQIAPFGILTTDREFRIRSWNQWMVSQSGLGAETVIGRKLIDVFPDLEERHLFDRFVRALGGEISVLSTALHQYLLPLPVTVPETGLQYMLQTARIAPLPDERGIVGTITIIEDVTQREFQANILHRQQEIDRLLSTSLAMLLQSSDPAKDLAEIFLSIAPSLGLDAHTSYLVDPKTDTLRLNTIGGIPPRHREVLALMPFSASDRESNGELNLDLPATRAEHLARLREIGLRGSCAFPLSTGGRVVGILSFGSYERETIAPADVATLASISRYVAVVLDRALREHEAIAAARAKDDFLAALSHELRTPLNPVLLLASDSAANPDYPASAREAFRVIEKNALLEARLIDDLLDLTRIEHNKLALEMQRLDVHATLRDAIGMVRAEASEKEISLEVALDAAQSVISGDAGRLQQVFWNVLKNGIKFTPRGGRISVRTSIAPTGTEIDIQISDTGIGMEPHEVARIFGAFAQGDHAEQSRGHRFGGLGLGLAISRRLMELHAGRIEASSEGRDRGATFRINIPLMAVKDGAGAAASAASTGRPTKPAAAATKSSGRILLVEDHEPTRGPLTRLLVRRGFDVAAVGTAAAALEAAEKASFDLVLSDIGLPDSDGFSLMRELRGRYGISGIALTGYGMEQDVLQSSEAGFVAHLTKPISVAVLDRALAMAFERNPG